MKEKNVKKIAAVKNQNQVKLRLTWKNADCSCDVGLIFYV